MGWAGSGYTVIESVWKNIGEETALLGQLVIYAVYNYKPNQTKAIRSVWKNKSGAVYRFNK